jgi:hypothetical protein
MLKIGDRVFHIEYPSAIGQVVAKMPSNGMVLVRWINSLGQYTNQSRHIPSALRRVQRPR